MNLKLGVETNLKFEDRPKRSILPQYDEPDLDKSKKTVLFWYYIALKFLKMYKKCSVHLIICIEGDTKSLPLFE